MLSVWMAAVLDINSADQWPHGIPSESTQTVIWKCGGRTSVAEIRTVGRRSGSEPQYSFTTKLVQLQVNGRAASQETLRQVQAALDPLYSVGKFLARCDSPQVPALLITGHVKTGEHQSEPRMTLLDLH